MRPPARRICGLPKSRTFLSVLCFVLLAALGFASATLAQSLSVFQPTSSQSTPLQITGPNGATSDGKTIAVDTAEFTFAATDAPYTCSLTGLAPSAPATACVQGSTLTYPGLTDGIYEFVVAAQVEDSNPTWTRTFAVSLPTVNTDSIPSTSDTTSAPTDTAVVNPPHHGNHPKSTAPIAGGTAGGIVLAGTATLFLRRHRFRIRLELSAEDEKPEGRCHGGGWRCQKRLVLKPARRRITYLVAATSDDAGKTRAQRFDGELVDQLNDVVSRYRHSPHEHEELKLALLPIASALTARFDEWLLDLSGASRPIAIAAHLEGGKMATGFTPFHCEHGEWKTHRSWSHEFADERDETVGSVTHPRVDLRLFAAQLASFVALVDIPPTGRAVTTSVAR